MARQDNVAPEGSWGWVVAAGLAASLIVTLGPQICFGMIFGEFLEDLGEGTRGATLVNSVFMTIHSFTGLLANYVLKSYSCRTVAFVGALLFYIGNFLTTFATNVYFMIATFSILPGVGLGLLIPASYTAFNSYFVRRRVFVMGVTQTLLSAGIMAYPLLVEYLIVTHDFRWAQGVVATLTLSAVVASLAYLPVDKSHRPAKVLAKTLCCRDVVDPGAAGDELADPVAAAAAVKHNGVARPTEPHVEPLLEKEPPAESKVEESKANGCVENGGLSASGARGSRLSVVSVGAVGVLVPEGDGDGEKKGCWHSVVDFLDLGLLKDPVYTNLNLGVSMSFYSDFTFTILMPLFLRSLGLSLADTAACLTVGTACDVVGRIVFSLQSACCKVSSRTTFLVGSACIVISRTVMIYTNGLLAVAIVSGIHGFFRSWIHITFSLVFAEHCSLDRFPSAYGLYMAVSGVIGMATGPLVGWIRDYTGSYAICIHSLNAQMMLCVIPWCLELLIVKIRSSTSAAKPEKS